MRPPFYKRKYLIDPKIQIEVTLYLVLFAILALAVIFVSVRQSLLMLFENTARLDSHCSTLLRTDQENATTILSTVFFTQGIALFVFAFIGGILISHRLLGPIYRFKRVLRQLAAGEDPGRIQIRKNDYLADMVPLLQELKDAREKKSD